MPKTIPYRRILALVELGPRNPPQNAHLVAQAAAMARASGAQLRLLHIVDVEAGLDGGPGLTPGQEARAFEALLLPRLHGLAQATGLTGVSCDVRVGRPAAALRGYTHEWTPDLVVTAHPHGLGFDGPWDLLALGHSAPSWRQRLKAWFKTGPAALPPLADPA